MKNAPQQLRVVSVVGARPQFIKVAPLHHELVRRGITHEIIHSGQHYDDGLSAQFFRDFSLPEPVVNLAAGSGTHAAQTSRIIAALDGALDQRRAHVVLAYGDTNTTLATGVVVSKRSELLVHIEAGLRSGNWSMPEEVNRVLVDHASDLLLAPTAAAQAQLITEGLGKRSVLVGDVMLDSLQMMMHQATKNPPTMPAGWPPRDTYVFATLHRAENTDHPSRLRHLIDRLDRYPIPVQLAAHPRLVTKLQEFGIAPSRSLTLWPTLSYAQTIHAVLHSSLVVTDSGGLQKEVALLARPCITARTETEWQETISAGWNVLDPDLQVDPIAWAATTRAAFPTDVFGAPHVASRIVDAIIERYEQAL